MRVAQMRWVMLSLLVLLTGCSADHPYITKGAEPSPTQRPSSTPSTRSITAKASPISLIIPALQLHADVESVGIQANADLATPVDNPWEDVGWYNGGPYPGERG